MHSVRTPVVRTVNLRPSAVSYKAHDFATSENRLSATTVVTRAESNASHIDCFHSRTQSDCDIRSIAIRRTLTKSLLRNWLCRRLLPTRMELDPGARLSILAGHSANLDARTGQSAVPGGYIPFLR